MPTMTEQATHTIRVLLAEDDDNARTLLVDLLNTLGHVVVAEVATGREVYERAHELVPDVVLLDVHMPDGSGIDAAERITNDTPRGRRRAVQRRSVVGAVGQGSRVHVRDRVSAETGAPARAGLHHSSLEIAKAVLASEPGMAEEK